MRTARKVFINAFFAYLKGEDYIALKYILDAPTDLANSSDVDLLVGTNLILKIERFCNLHPLVSMIKTQTCGERYSLRIYLADGGYLKLDLLTDFQRSGIIYLSQEACRKSMILKGEVQTYSPQLLLEHTFLYYFLNSSAVPEKYIEYFRQLPHKVRSGLLPHLAAQYQVSFTSFEDLSTFDEGIRLQLENQLKSWRTNSWLSVWRRRLKQGSDQIMGRAKNSGRIITFSGVDGAGKTTLLNRLAEILHEEQDEKVVLMRHRPGLLPILSAWTMGKKAASDFHAQRLPRQGTNRSLASSLLRFGYYFLDYLLGQWWIQLRYCALGYTVIYDRYYFDFMADPRRSNLQLPQWLTQRLYALLLQPSLNIFLYAKPSTILQRKQELDESTITALTQRYKSIFDHYQVNKTAAAYTSIQNEHAEGSMRQILQWYNYQRA